MKKLAVLLALLLSLTGCGSGGDDVIEIKEKLFIEGCNDVYLNAGEYEGKTLKLEGIYNTFLDEATGTQYQYVIRNGPGCCGNDGVAGFEITWDGGGLVKNDWIEVIGEVELAGLKDGAEHVRIKASSVKVLEKRGAEFVTN